MGSTDSGVKSLTSMMTGGSVGRGVVVVGAMVVVVGGGTFTGMSNLEDPTSRKLFHLPFELLFIMLLLLLIVCVLKEVCEFMKFILFDDEESTPNPQAA